MNRKRIKRSKIVHESEFCDISINSLKSEYDKQFQKLLPEFKNTLNLSIERVFRNEYEGETLCLVLTWFDYETDEDYLN